MDQSTHELQVWWESLPQKPRWREIKGNTQFCPAPSTCTLVYLNILVYHTCVKDMYKEKRNVWWLAASHGTFSLGEVYTVPNMIYVNKGTPPLSGNQIQGLTVSNSLPSSCLPIWLQLLISSVRSFPHNLDCLPLTPPNAISLGMNIQRGVQIIPHRYTLFASGAQWFQVTPCSLTGKSCKQCLPTREV